MIINTYKAGQLGNRLFHISQLIVTGIETDNMLVDFSFDEYKDHFRNTCEHNFIIYPQKKASPLNYFLFEKLRTRIPNIRDFILHRKLGSQYFKYINQNGLVIENYSDFISERKKISHYIIEGWISKDITPLYRYRSLLADFFNPLQQYTENVKKLIENGKRNVDLLIGIHIRRGDFKEYRNGELYFDDAIYANLMKDISVFYSDKKIRFLLCSNENIEWDNYGKFDVIPANGHLIEDMYSLAECNYIAGPVSTYSMWASFTGEKPLYQIKNREQVFDGTKFKIIKDRS